MIRKTHALIAFLSICCTAAFAQPVLNAANSNPVNGDVLYIHGAYTAGVALPAAGTNVLWNYYNLSQQWFDSSMYVSCGVTPGGCASYPGTTIVNDINGSDSYYKADTSEFDQLNLFNVPGGGNALDTFTLIKYPFTYNSSFSDTFRIATATDTFMGINHTDAIGYGTLQLPFGLFHDVLLMHNTYTRIIRSATASTNINTQQHYYTWNKAGLHYPVLAISADTTGGTALIPKRVSYISDPLHPNAIADITSPAGRIIISPNPVTDKVQISYNKEIMDDDKIIITDITGREVLTSSCGKWKTAQHEISLAVPQLANGVYTLCLYTHDGKMLTKLVKL